jgi:hypothetical protein
MISSKDERHAPVLHSLCDPVPGTLGHIDDLGEEAERALARVRRLEPAGGHGPRFEDSMPNGLHLSGDPSNAQCRRTHVHASPPRAKINGHRDQSDVARNNFSHQGHPGGGYSSRRTPPQKAT